MSLRTIPASPGQRLLSLMGHYGGEAGVLNCPVLMRFRGTLDVAALGTAIDQLTARHEALRTTFVGTGRHLRQVVHPPQSMPLRQIDLGSNGQTSSLQDAIDVEIATHIDAAAWPVRSTLWSVGASDHVLCLNMHHLAGDGWSCGVIYRELLLHYGRLVNGPVEIPPVGWQFADFVEWQARFLESEAAMTHAQYWRRQLDRLRFPTPPFREGAAPPSRRIGHHSARLDGRAVAALRQMARERRTTLFTVMLSIACVLLLPYAESSDVAVGSVFANRVGPEVEHTVGPLAHMLVLRTRLHRVVTFGDVLRETHGAVAGAFLHQQVPYHMVRGVRVAGRSRRADDVVFQMAGKSLTTTEVGGVVVSPLEVAGMGRRFGFESAILPVDDGLTVAVCHDAARVDESFASKYLSDYMAIAMTVADDPDVRLARLAA